MNITLVGSGNIAYFFGLRLYEKGCTIKQIYSRNLVKGKSLGDLIACKNITSELNEINKDSDCYLIALSDDALPIVAEKLQLGNKVVCHFSGSTDINILSPVSENYGVIWPMYSINKNNLSEENNIPLIIEGNNYHTINILSALSSKLSAKVLELNYEKRKYFHLCSVIANNFTHHLLVIVQEICKKENLPFDFLYPIIEQTFQNISSDSLIKLQTGPAVRKDRITMNSHQELLKENPLIKKIYETISESIMKININEG